MDERASRVFVDTGNSVSVLDTTTGALLRSIPMSGARITNDAMAVGALLALHESNVDVPGEISVVGFDDIPIARYVTPALTTVHVAIDVLGGRAAALLWRSAALLARA